MQAIVEMKRVSRRYGHDGVTVDALLNVDLTIERGAFAAVAGPSGSGKSTLLNVMSGLDVPTGGSVVVAGRELTKLSAKALAELRLNQIGFVFQAYNLLPVLTVLENAEYVLMLQGVGKKQRREKVMSLLEQVGLAGLEHRFPRELSGGQQQRVAIARAIASEPAIVLADEPTANLDSKTGGALMDLMAELNERRGVTFIFSTHDQRVIGRAGRLISLKDGQLVEEQGAG